MRELSFLFLFYNDSPLRKIEGRHFQIHFITRLQPAGFLAAPLGNMPQQPMAVHQLHPKESRLFQYFDDGALKANGIRSRHAKLLSFPRFLRKERGI